MADAPQTTSERFIDNLNLGTMETLRLNTAWAVGNSNSAVRGILSSRTPDQMMEALEKSVDDPEALKLIKTIRADETLSKAVHNAAVKDSSFLPGLEKVIGNPAGADGLSAADLNDMLAHPVGGALARNQLTKTLNEVAERDDLGFDHLMKVGEQGKKLAKADFGNFFERMRSNDPEVRHGLIRDLLANSQIQDPNTLNMIAGLMDKVLPFVAHFLDPNGFMLKDATEYYDVHLKGSLGGLGRSGSEILAGVHARGPKTAGLSADEAKKYVGDSKAEVTGREPKVTMGDGGALASKQKLAAHAADKVDAEPDAVEPANTVQQPRPSSYGMSIGMPG